MASSNLGNEAMERSTRLVTPYTALVSPPGEANSDHDVFEGQSIEDISHSVVKKRTPKGGTLKAIDAAWYMFDNLSCDQAEDLLRQHGEHGTYLIAHFHDPESYGLSIRLNDRKGLVFKHYAVGITGSEYHAEGISGTFSNIEDVVKSIEEKIAHKLIPIFHTYDEENSHLSISVSAEAPPDYKEAQRFPQAARISLPIIVPIRPTLRRMMGTGRRGGLDNSSGELPEEIDVPQDQEEYYAQRGCCWKAFHTDINGRWYKPHKAGPVTAVLLVIGWILFLVLFGWIVALALIFVLILVAFAYVLNFVCTGRCRVEEEETPVNNRGGTGGRAENGYQNGDTSRRNRYS